MNSMMAAQSTKSKILVKSMTGESHLAILLLLKPVRRWSMRLRYLILLPLCSAVDLLLEKVVEQCPNGGNSGKLPNIRPSRGNGRPQDIGTKLKLESQSQPSGQTQANILDLRLLSKGCPSEKYPNHPYGCLQSGNCNEKCRNPFNA
jgi:hypothetical protein